MIVSLAGPGLMGSQIAVEYALGGHDVFVLEHRHDEAVRRIVAAFETARGMGLWTLAEIEAAEARMTIAPEISALPARSDIAAESIVEDFYAKADLLQRLAEQMPEAILASNTSAISISALGAAAGASERTVGVHYWNPPLLMPLVEVIKGDHTSETNVQTMLDVLRNLGKSPVQVDRDVEGFVWNRMQLALLREAIWIVENGVATPEVVDQIVREGLARRWRYTGPFETVALGGPETFTRVANNLWPSLSTATSVDDLARWLRTDPEVLATIKVARDAGLLDDLKRDRQADP